jgi:homoserine kinase
MHQPYRQKLVPGLAEALALQHADLLGICLGGAGPSIVALAERNLDFIEQLLSTTFAQTGLPFTIRRLAAHQSSASGT